MTDHPASWRMPTRKQMDRMAAAVGRKAPATPGLAPSDDLPPEYWQAFLDDPRADGANRVARASGRALRLDEIPQHLLRVNCRRCGRTVEIQRADAIRLYGQVAIWGLEHRRSLRWRAAHVDIPQRAIDKRPLQRLGIVPMRAQPPLGWSNFSRLVQSAKPEVAK